VDQKIPIIGGAAVDILDRIQDLLTASPIIEASETVKLRAAQRALERKAPFHHDKNSMADAIIIETYADCIHDEATSGVRFAFVTHNKSDFSVENDNQKIPLQTLLISSRVLSRSTLSICLRRSVGLTHR